jgi:hypothetical protein
MFTHTHKNYPGRHRIGLALPAGSGFLPVLVDTPSGAADWSFGTQDGTQSVNLAGI